MCSSRFTPTARQGSTTACGALRCKRAKSGRSTCGPRLVAPPAPAVQDAVRLMTESRPAASRCRTPGAVTIGLEHLDGRQLDELLARGSRRRDGTVT